MIPASMNIIIIFGHVHVRARRVCRAAPMITCEIDGISFALFEFLDERVLFVING